MEGGTNGFLIAVDTPDVVAGDHRTVCEQKVDVSAVDSVPGWGGASTCCFVRGGVCQGAEEWKENGV